MNMFNIFLVLILNKLSNRGHWTSQPEPGQMTLNERQKQLALRTFYD